MRAANMACLAAIGLMPVLAKADENVALRARDGRFLRLAEDGTLRPERLYPAEAETLVLLSRGKDQVALRWRDGRYLVHDGRTLRAGNTRVEPGPRETFQLLPAGENRFAFKPVGLSGTIDLMPPAVAPPEPKPATPLAARQTVEIWRVGDVPTVVQTALVMAIRGLAGEGVAGKQYDKTRTHKTEKYVDLPAPTLHDPKRTKRHQVLGVTEEYRVQAQLDGTPDVQITRMPLLKPYGQTGTGVIQFVVQARLPARGRVQGKVDGVAKRVDGLSHGRAACGRGRGQGAPQRRRRRAQPAGRPQPARLAGEFGSLERPAGCRPAAD